MVGLDTNVTPDLEREGLARDVIRAVQQARKDADLHIADNIRLRLVVPDPVKAAVEAHKDYVSEQTLAVDLGFGALVSGMFESQTKLGKEQITIGLTKV